MISDSTLPFSKMPHHTVKIPTFHWSAANVFYWLYTIIYIRPVHAIRIYTTIFENAPPHCANPYIPSISCKRILLIIHYHLHQTCPCYQTLHYHFRKCPTPLCKSIHSINQLQTDSIDYTLSFTSYLSMLSDSTLPFSKMTHPALQIPTFHRSADNIFYWLYTIIYSRPVHDIRLYTTIFENAPPHCANPYITLISC